MNKRLRNLINKYLQTEARLIDANLQEAKILDKECDDLVNQIKKLDPSFSFMSTIYRYDLEEE